MPSAQWFSLGKKDERKGDRSNTLASVEDTGLDVCKARLCGTAAVVHGTFSLAANT